MYIDPELKWTDPLALNVPLLRYMGKDSFFRLIDNSAVPFSKIGSYKDLYEGVFFPKDIAHALISGGDNLDFINYDLIIDQWIEYQTYLRNSIFSCCWHEHPSLRETGSTLMVPIESNIMWEAYTHRDCGIAIHVKLGDLMSLPYEDIGIFKVKYRDPKTQVTDIDIKIKSLTGKYVFDNLNYEDYPHPIKTAIYKTNNYKLESEIRLIYYHDHESQNDLIKNSDWSSRSIPDLNKFISAIIISPFFEEKATFKDEIESHLISKGYPDLAKKVRYSQISEKLQ